MKAISRWGDSRMSTRVQDRVAEAIKRLIADRSSGWTRNSIAEKLEQLHEAGLTPARCDNHSLERLLTGGRCQAGTVESVRQFLLHYTEIRIMRDMSESPIDLASFLSVPNSRYISAIRDIIGEYQLYAVSNIIPDFLWRARVQFWSEEEGLNARLYIYLKAARQRIDSFASKEYRSEGQVSPIGEYMYTTVFRSDFETGDESAVPTLFQRIGRTDDGNIERMRAHAIQYEPEEGRIMHSHWALVRADSLEIVDTFIHRDDVKDRWLRRELAL